jgi:hypothetical protein
MATLDRMPATEALYYESEDDRERRYAMQSFYEDVKPSVSDFIEKCLTPRQKEVVKLYYYYGKTQEDIAVILQLTQSTVSPNFRNGPGGKKVGETIKLRKLIDRTDNPVIMARFLQPTQGGRLMSSQYFYFSTRTTTEAPDGSCMPHPA